MCRVLIALEKCNKAEMVKGNMSLWIFCAPSILYTVDIVEIWDE